MTRDEIVSLVLSRLGKRESNTYLVTQARTELQIIQRTKLEKGMHMPYFLLSDETALVVNPGVRLGIDLPSNFLREWDQWQLALYDATLSDPYTDLLKDDFDILKSRYGSDSASTPKAYSLVGSAKAAVFPLSDVVREARLVYFKKEDVLSDSVSTNAWTVNAEDVLISELGVVMSRYARSDLLSEFKDDAQRAQDRMFYESLARLNAAREAYRGDKETD